MFTTVPSIMAMPLPSTAAKSTHLPRASLSLSRVSATPAVVVSLVNPGSQRRGHPPYLKPRYGPRRRIPRGTAPMWQGCCMISDHELALALATESGQLLLGLRDLLGFDDPTTLRAAGDAHSHNLLMQRFAAERPDDAVLSEEGDDDKVRLDADRVWIVDPLDGTREYGEEGRTDWAVHVALWVRGQGLTAGAVALPAAGAPLATLLVQEGFATPVYDGPPRIVVSRTRAPAWVGQVAADLDATTVPMGS